MVSGNFSSVGRSSWDVEKWVREHSKLRGYDFLVSLTIASMHNQRKGYAFPTMERLVKESRTSESTIKRAIKHMRDSGEWIILSGSGGPERDSGQFTARANRYYPTAVLSGVEPLDDGLFASPEAGLLLALDNNGITNPSEVKIMIEVWEALPDNFRNDLCQQLASKRYKKQIDGILEKGAAIKNGYDNIKATVQTGFARTRTQPIIITSWLNSWGMLYNKQIANAGAFAGMADADEIQNKLMGSQPHKPHYGKTGQDI